MYLLKRKKPKLYFLKSSKAELYCIRDNKWQLTLQLLTNSAEKGNPEKKKKNITLFYIAKIVFCVFGRWANGQSLVCFRTWQLVYLIIGKEQGWEMHKGTEHGRWRAGVKHAEWQEECPCLPSDIPWAAQDLQSTQGCTAQETCWTQKPSQVFPHHY